MSTTDAALDWLLSLSATLTSSPVPNSDSPDFTDWLRVSSATSSPITLEPPPTSSVTSPPFQDVTSSSRVNISQAGGLRLNYLYDLSDFFSSDVSVASGSQNGLMLQDGHIDGVEQASSQPAQFNQHNRMISLDSVTATLVNTPSPRSTRMFSAGPTGVLRNESDNTSPFSSLFYSPATKYIQDLQDTTFGSYLNDLTAPVLPSYTPVDVSPVVRASKLQEHILSDDNKNQAKLKSKAKAKKGRRNRHVKPALSFVEKLRAVQAPANVRSTSAVASPGDMVSTPLSGLSFEPPLVLPLSENVLLSPCRFETTCPIAIQRENDLSFPILPMPSFGNTVTPDLRQNAPSTPSHVLAPIEALSPLTPLTSLSSSSPDQRPRLKIVINLKRTRDDSAGAVASVRRSKRPRRNIVLVESPSSPDITSPPRSSQSSSVQNSYEDPKPVYTNRTLPTTIEVSENFPLFYRRFPASSYYMHGDADSPCTLFGVIYPGGVYNPSRGALDLYTPRFVKGKGVEKVGLCPICIEPPERGGEKKKLWLAMKFSAFKCYHMQYAHGISASTGRPFSPPTAFRIVPRLNPGKKEKHQIQQGKCHKCGKWVAVEGIKDMESKVKELHWWKHAAACHQESALEGECDYFEHDHVLATLLSLKTTEHDIV